MGCDASTIPRFEFVLPGSAMPRTQRRIEDLLLIVAVGLLVAGNIAVLAPFASAILWAVVLCYATWPLFVRLDGFLGGRKSLAALGMCLAVTVVLVAPFLIVALSLGDNLARLVALVQDGLAQASPTPPAWLARIPLVGGWLAGQWSAIAVDPGSLAERVKQALPGLAQWALGRGLALTHGLMMLVASVFVAFFLYRDGEELARLVAVAVARVGGERGEALLTLAGSTIKGVVYGILGTALAQGVLAAIGFLVSGVPGALALGLITFFLSVVPVGPPLVWLPAALWLYAQGHTGMAVFLGLWGLLVVSSVDNFVKPYLISQGAALPFILVLFGVLGGLAAFGFLGVFLGPTLLALGFGLLKAWTAETLSPDAKT